MTELVDGPPMVAPSVVVARVPVVDSSRRIVGFELVNRLTDEAPAPAREGVDPVVTESSLIGSIDVDLTPLVGDKLLFCAVDRDALLSETRLRLPVRRTVLQVPSTGVDADLVDAVLGYQQAGYTIMVPHTEWTAETKPLLHLADYVRIDLGSRDPQEVAAIVDGYRDQVVDLVVSGCDDERLLTWARAAGFTLFLGKALRMPEPADDSVTAPLPVSQVQLSMELLSEDLDLDRIEDVLRGDPVLVAQLLTMASSGADGGLRRQVRSLREALVLLGTERLRQWAGLVILSRHCQRETDALLSTLVRARTCELLARSTRVDAPFAFTAGVLSSLGTLLGVPTEEVEKQIVVVDELAAAAFRRQGPVGELIARVEEHEQWSPGDPKRPDHDQVTLIGAMAFGWATSYVQQMESAAAE